MSESSDKSSNVSASTGEGAGSLKQIGPWKDGETLRLTLVDDRAHELVRIAATADNPQIHSYNTWREYWSRAPDPTDLVGLTDGAHLDLRLESGPYTDDQLDDFFGDFTRGPEPAETPPPWQEDPYTIPDDVTPLLFSLPDTDPEARAPQMGFSILLTTGTWEIFGVVWHKTFNPPSGMAWKPPRLDLPPGYLTFVGRRSSPHAIEPSPGTSWYHVKYEMLQRS